MLPKAVVKIDDLRASQSVRADSGHFFPPADFFASGNFLNVYMAHIPKTGPSAKKEKAHCQPNQPSSVGMRRMVISVNKNPGLVYSVRAVPVYSVRHISLMAAEN